jgi:hypothetical protein
MSPGQAQHSLSRLMGCYWKEIFASANGHSGGCFSARLCAWASNRILHLSRPCPVASSTIVKGCFLQRHTRALFALYTSVREGGAPRDGYFVFLCKTSLLQRKEVAGSTCSCSRLYVYSKDFWCCAMLHVFCAVHSFIRVCSCICMYLYDLG